MSLRIIGRRGTEGSQGEEVITSTSYQNCSKKGMLGIREGRPWLGLSKAVTTRCRNISFQNLTGVEEIKGGGKFGNFLGIRNNKNVREYRVLRCDAEWRGRSQLVNTTSESTNRKRARDPKVEISEQNITPCKKMKV